MPLTIIVNQSLCTGIFPDKLKIAKVIPLYKKQDEKVIGNYRPISLLSSVSKVFEKIVFDQLYDYFTTNGLLFNSQYGFRKHHSTELVELMDKIRREIDQKKTPFSVYLDLSKAFDNLKYAMLLKKLILWLAGHHFILVQKLPFWPYPVRWIRRSSFGKETYRNRCATRFNIGSFIICYMYEWHTECGSHASGACLNGNLHTKAIVFKWSLVHDHYL